MSGFCVFDMDNTLIGTDSDLAWKNFLVAKKLAPASDLEEQERYYEDFLRGAMDEQAFCRFQFREFAGRTPEEITALSRECFSALIAPYVRSRALEFVRECRRKGTPTAIITSTNTLLASCVAGAFTIPVVIGSEPELRNGRFTGNLTGPYMIKAAKAQAVRRLAAAHGVPEADFTGFGDSINDLEMLACCGTACAVNPTPGLAHEAAVRKWQVLDWED